MMNGAEIDLFAKALDTAYLTPNSFNDLLVGLGKSLAAQAPQSANLPQAMRATVGNSVAEGWNGNLLQAVHFDRPENELLKVFFAVHGHLDPGRNPHWNNPWQSTRLVGEQLFMGRAQIRNRLRRMDGDPTSKKVMVIASEMRKVGKTHTCSLVKFVRPGPNHKLTYLDLDERRYEDTKTASHNLRAIAFELADQWGIEPCDLPKQGEEQEDRWAQLLAPYLVEKADKAGHLVRWLVIDGFRKRNKPSVGVKELIDRLSELLMSEPNFRLLLLNYREPLPVQVRYFEEWVQPLTKPEIAETLESACVYYLRRLPTAREMTEFMQYYADRLAEYQRNRPEYADSHLLLHHAAADTVDRIQESLA